MTYFLFVFLFFNTACSSLHSLKKNPSDKELFQHALQLKEKSYYKESLSYFKKLKSRFLYSHLVKEADLAIADIYFAQEEWQKAARAYNGFSELHPNHPKNDSVLFHLALSYFHQLPATEDRDLSFSKKTLFYLNQHLTRFPKSPHRNQTLQHKQKILNLLAQKQWMIAHFHLNQGKPHSALPYMLKLMKDYSFLLPVKEEEAGKKAQTQANQSSTPPSPSNSDLPTLKKLKKMVRELKTQKNTVSD